MPGFRSPTRRHLFTMVVSVLALDAVAIAVYYGVGIATAGANARNAFTLGWTIATLLVVGRALGRIRRERKR